MTTLNQEIDNALKSHDKAITEIQATLSALSEQQEAILKAVAEKTGSGSGEGGGSGSSFNTNRADSSNNRSLRIGKIDFSKFSGDDVEGWVYRCEHFFAMDETPEGMKLRYVVVHLEGDALQWHLAYLHTRNATVAEIQWDEYVRSISARFSNAMFEDPLEELASLNQTAKTTFTKPNEGPRRLTSTELKYKRANGECFWCTEKFVPGHKCPRNRNQVYVIEMEDDDDEETEEIGAETEEKEHRISIHALTGLPSYSEVFQTPKGLPPTRPFDPGEMDQSEQDATWEFLDELQLRFPDFSELVSCGQEIF
uniref:Retrotransposon gag domain-containing protein n=1 Tax=Tanacetum cinerariifolium TaxID=118510 RepID=A0A699HQ35_TANCI|nr:hypothetical protein [Tanacetum cinerariifolium]